MAFKDFHSFSDQAILQELGDRFKALRLRKNLSQQELAERTLLSLNTIKALENGKAKLATIVAVMRELGVLEQLEELLEEPKISPLQLAKRRGRPRQRATGSRGKFGESAKDDVEW